MAAGAAAEQSARVLLLEKMSRPGRKLLISGKGRCNLTNIAPPEEFIKHFGKNGQFLRQAFNAFSPDKLVAFFAYLGVETVNERGGRVFPVSQKALDVVDALQNWVVNSGVNISPNTDVESLLMEDGRCVGVHIRGVEKQPGRDIYGKTVIIATGGKSYPATGSTGDGYRLAESVGHTILPTMPALVPLMTEPKPKGDLVGLSLRNINAQLWIDGKKHSEQFGEMEFSRNGLTGPVILTLSKQVVEALHKKSKVEIVLDLKPALNVQKLDRRLRRDLELLGKRQFGNILKGLLPVMMIPYCIAQTGIPYAKYGNQVSSEERKRLRIWLKECRWNVTGHRSYAEAIVTAGGVKLSEINPRTMGSRLVEGLYFAGEVIDVDADTGGFNLQAAFSMGRMAGQAAAEFATRD